MPRTIHVQLIVHPAQGQGLSSLNEAVCRYFLEKGFKAVLPHIYPEDPLIIEVVEEIPLHAY